MLINTQLLPLYAHATVSCRLSLYKLLCSFSHPSLPCFSIKLDYRYSVWVHTWHFALHIAGWVGPLTHHHHLSCGLHHTLQVHISTCHFQLHVAGCVAATLICCIAGCVAATPFIAQGVSLPPSLAAARDVAAIPIQTLKGCIAATLLCAGVHPIAVVPFTAKDCVVLCITMT